MESKGTFTLRSSIQLLVLFIVHFTVQWQQYFLVYVSDGDTARTSFTRDMQLDNEQFAIVTGTAFTIVNSFGGIVMGYQVDFLNRKYLLVVCSFLWNLL